jgi:predicted PurR-regulated permease PerM
MINGQPSSANLAYNLHIILVTIFLLYFGQAVLIPIAFACLIALLLMPVCSFFEKQGFPRLFAALISIILGVLFFVVVSYFVSAQIINFKNDLPEMARRLTESLEQLQRWVVAKFRLTPGNVEDFVNSTAEQILSKTSIIVSTTFLTIGRVLLVVLLIPVYAFLLLLYRQLIMRFLIAFFDKRQNGIVKDIIFKTRVVVKGYIVGLFIETIVVAVLTWIGFFILGVKYAILLAIVSALLKLIPYLGIISAMIISMLITMTTNSMATVWGVFVVLLVVHLVDGNFLFPVIVSSKVKMNALATIVGVIVWSALWGIPGMFLAIPILATLKVIFDSVEPLKAWGILLGDDPRIPKITKKG